MTTGQLTIYCGPMFARKTTALIAEVQVLKEMKPDSVIRVFKPSLDNRYDLVDIKTHDGHSLQNLTSLAVEPVAKDFDFSKVEAEIIVVDEIQFFDDCVYGYIEKCLLLGKDVVAAGLDLDSQGLPFGIMPNLLALADYVEKQASVCVVCKKPATRTYRKVDATDKILVGGSDIYEPRCLDHWQKKL